MRLFFIFGYPGSGKTYVSTILKNEFGFYHHDGDHDIPQNMKQALQNEAPITDTMRDTFFQALLLSTKTLVQTHTNLVVSQTFLKDSYRKQFLNTFPHAQFLYVQTNEQIRNMRLKNRTNYPLSPIYAQKMVSNFEQPSIPYKTIENNEAGDTKLIEQLTHVVSNTSQMSK